MPGLDLHIHSIASDGGHDAAAIAAAARAAGLALVAIADHERTAESALLPALLPGRAVTAAEILVRTELGFADLLALGLRDPGRVQARLAPEHIFTRSIAIMIERLPSIGLRAPEEPIPARGRSASRWLAEAVLAVPANRAILAARGITEPGDFRYTYLWKGRPLSAIDELMADPAIPGIGEIIELVHAAGGLTSMAHPYIGPAADPRFEAALADWADQGLGALEAYHPAQDEAMAARLAGLAARHGLLVGAGSDSHGTLTLGSTSPVPAEALVAAWRDRLGLP